MSDFRSPPAWILALALGMAWRPGAAADPAEPAVLAEPPQDAQRTLSGLAYKVLRPGTGREHPGPDATVVVHYTGWTADGRMFDTSLTLREPPRFGLRDVIPGWAEGVQLMVVGEKTRFWIPQDLAYKGVEGKPMGTLVYDVELLAFTDSPATPADVASPRPTRRGRPRGWPTRSSGPAPAPAAPAPPRGSRSTTPAGRRTAGCSTARSPAASRPPSP